MRRWVVRTVLLLLVFTIGACTGPTFATDVPSVDLDSEMHRQAVDALARWDGAAAAFPGPVLVLVGPTFGAVGGSEAAAAKYQKSATDGIVEMPSILPAMPAEAATVRFADGQTSDLPMLQPQDAWRDAPRPLLSDCVDCFTLSITGAELHDGVVATTRGPVTMPVWEYSIANTAIRLTRPAVVIPGPKVTLPSWDSSHPPAGLQFDFAQGSVTGRTVTVSFVGTRNGSDTSCGADYRPEALESTSAVVIVLHETRHSPSEMCTMIGFPRSATATLASPLGDRAVLEGRMGAPVPTVRMP